MLKNKTPPRGKEERKGKVKGREEQGVKRGKQAEIREGEAGGGSQVRMQERANTCRSPFVRATEAVRWADNLSSR